MGLLTYFLQKKINPILVLKNQLLYKIIISVMHLTNANKMKIKWIFNHFLKKKKLWNAASNLKMIVYLWIWNKNKFNKKK
jgi:hypothetical protein